MKSFEQELLDRLEELEVEKNLALKQPNNDAFVLMLYEGIFRTEHLLKHLGHEGTFIVPTRKPGDGSS